MTPTVEVYETISALEDAAAEYITTDATASIQDRGVFTISLAGGNTPRGVYRRLATSPYRDRIDWSRVHVCFGDERVVGPDDPQSNFGMATEELLSRVPLAETNVHRIHGEWSADAAAKAYAEEMKYLLRGQSDRLDLVVLGLGADGHTASLFPGTDVLDEDSEMVRAVFVPELTSWRVTMTYPLLNRARAVLFLVAGIQKAAIVQRVLSSRRFEPVIPASGVLPADGTVRWMLDIGAAAALGGATLR